jgi:hypothetical protein
VITSQTACALDWLAEAKQGWKGKTSSTTIHRTSIHGLSTNSLFYGKEASHKQFTHFMKVVKISTDCTRQVSLPFWCSEVCEAGSQKGLLNNDSRHTTWNGKFWLSWVKVQTQHLSKHWQASIDQEPGKS